ncbi:SAV_2336 N-terminal domain-related protein [Streptomyces sp. CRN 30]|uniref:SAV_2336 N-terminal domain-related protein n=1 Tax=Streptomyces sp. CRN 30 TaxID=3075613 RepID=UPI002A83B6D1|nr:SAV_2336 N-terminal domain-related protein [Streptomyces sp. CRN 30]
MDGHGADGADPAHAADGAAGAGRLAELLAQVRGEHPTSVELAELLWLARHMAPVEPRSPEHPRSPSPGDADAPAATAPPSGHRPPAAQEPEAGAASDPESAPEPEPDLPPGHEPGHEPERADGRVPLRLAGDGPPDAGSAPYTSLLAPAPPMLARPLPLQRALRPLKRRVPAPSGHELDEEATAHRIARLGAAPRWWLPVLRPAGERWLTLRLVHDSGPTMPVWRPLVRELHTALVQSGVFRTVVAHRLASDGTVRGWGAREPYADGRTVTLLVSDCSGPQWRDGEAGRRWYRALRSWAARMPVAVVQPLPERLWRTTALPAAPARLSSPWPVAPCGAYEVDPYATGTAAPGSLPLPVLEPAAPWLANWSRLLTGAGPVPGAVAPLLPGPPPDPVDERGRADVDRLSAEELVLRFRSLASPEAFRLAGHLAVGRPELPVMRLVQAAVDPCPRPQHLAEVILSGMLTAEPGPPGTYAFRQGVRELLLRTLPRTAHSRTAGLLARVGAPIDARAGLAAGEIPVAAPGRGGAAVRGEPFATVREESVLRLGGVPVDRAPAHDPDGTAGGGRTLLTAGTGDPHAHPRTHQALGRLLPWLLALGGLGPDAYDTVGADSGHAFLLAPGASVAPVLQAVVRELPGALRELDARPGVRVTFRHPGPPAAAEEPPARDGTPADLTVVLSPALHGELEPADAARFRPLAGPSPDAPPRAWFLPLDLPGHAPQPGFRDLVRGPLTAPSAELIRPPEPGRTAVVTASPASRSPVTYYEVDLTTHRDTHQLLLPSADRSTFVAAAELSWHVSDPEAFVRGRSASVAARLHEHLAREAARLTRRHPLRWAGVAQRAVHQQLGGWPVPGLAVTCAVRLSPGPAPRLDRWDTSTRTSAASDSLALVLADTESVLLGFPGTLARIPPGRRSRAARALATRLVELRRPEDALKGEHPLRRGAPAPLKDGHTDPLELLRALSHHPLASELSGALDEIEQRDLGAAPLTFAGPLVYALADRGLGVAVVTDHSARAVTTYLSRRGLTGPVSGGVHGRSHTPVRLMPDPDVLLRALERLGTAPDDAVLIGSSVAECTAASAIGLPFIGHAPDDTAVRRLREAGCRCVVTSLEPVLRAVRPT